MNLLIIHGPPAAGKYTVGNIIAGRTGYKLFHNHLSIDCTKPIIEFGTDAFWQLNVKIRCEVIAAAMRTGVNVIHTFCYGKGVDDGYFKQIIAAAEANGGTVQIVLLKCSDDERRRRIVNESRVRIGKLTDPGAVPTRGADLTSPLDSRDTLVIDNTSVPPNKAAEMIIDHYGLGPAENSNVT